MIAAVYARVLLATLGLLAVTTAASAECAWVLWASLDIPTSSPGPGVVTAYPTLSECDVALRGEATRLQNTGYGVTFPQSHVVLAFKGKAMVRWSCLPDTIDPRGPKGK